MKSATPNPESFLSGHVLCLGAGCKDADGGTAVGNKKIISGKTLFSSCSKWISMKREWRIFLTAVMFLTRINVGKHIDHSAEYLQRSSKYFPVVGWIVGAVCALTFLVVNRFISTDIALLASMIAGILTTGAFHEDGFADVCDAFGGGWTKEKILLIMKDSRLGTYGVAGLVLILATKFLLLKELPKFTPQDFKDTINPFLSYKTFIILLIAAHGLSRFMAVTVIQQYAYVQDEDVSKSKPLSNRRLSLPEMLLAGVLALLPFLFLSWHFLLIVPVCFAARTWLAAYFKRWIGGYTGDCLGAVQQVTEITFYLSALFVWRYIL
jgi:adenosylcobinamide-GDP ribazoletransferase